MSAAYLLKTEPSEYSFTDLQRDKATIWDGISNPAAVKNLREMKPGAKLIIYETGDVRSAVGTASVVTVDASDPKNPKVIISAGKPWPNQFHSPKSKQTGCSPVRRWCVKDGSASCYSRTSSIVRY